MFDLSNKKVCVAGNRGMVGAALVRRLQSENCDILGVGRKEVDFINQAAVETWMQSSKPDVVFIAAAKVGGIHANNIYPADFLYENLMIEANLIHAAFKAGVEKLVFLGSTCIYPRLAPQPMQEDSLLTGPLEPTNQWYAIAKIAGIKLCQAYRKQYGCDFISLMPTNLYGPDDNYNLENCHVLPALLRKAYEAKIRNAETLSVWGSGDPLREFLHVDDLADAVVFLTKNYSDENLINVGSGEEVSIRGLAEIICDVVGFKGELVFDASKPDGTPRKLSDVTKLKLLGWNNARKLNLGVKSTYEDIAHTWI
ncbi:MAG: GDP-L-fucose synthase [Hyphomicrobiales bacterium]